MTVICRRSADVWARAAAGGGCRGAGGGAAAAGPPAASPSLTPHCAQKREPGALAWPHAAQVKACGVPHCGQKRLAVAISLAQFGQVLVSAMHAIRYATSPGDRGDAYVSASGLWNVVCRRLLAAIVLAVSPAPCILTP